MESENIPNGALFLPGKGIGKLKRMLKKAKTKKEAIRIQACIKRKRGKSVRAISICLEIPYATVHRQLDKIGRCGLDALLDKEKPGAPCRLDKKERRQLYRIVAGSPKKYDFEGGTWTAKRLIVVVKDKFGVEYTERGMQLLLHRIGLASRTPRPRHPKAASAKEKATYRRRIAALRGRYPEHRVCMIDSASLIAGWNMQRGWYPVGESVFAPITLSDKRTHIVGALFDGELDVWFAEQVNTDTIEEILRDLLARKGKLIVILDNASWHHAKRIEEGLVKEFNGDLVLAHLPVYTPDLNSIERQWRMIRKAISNVIYRTVKAMKKAVTRALLSGDVRITRIATYAKGKNAEPPTHCTVRVEGESMRCRYYLKKKKSR